MDAGPTLAGFLDELEKIAAAHGRLRRPKERRGRRPMTVTTLLRKEKDGTLYKDAFSSPIRMSGADDVGAAKAPRRQGEVPTKGPNAPLEEKTGALPDRPIFSDPKKKVTKDDFSRIDRMDGRGDAATIPGPSTPATDVAPGTGDKY